MCSLVVNQVVGSETKERPDSHGESALQSQRVLVAYASKHGSTVEVAAQIAGVLGTRGLKVSLLRAEDVTSVAEYDAVVVGSAVYMGRWLHAARDLAAREAIALRQRPVWIFSTGPVGYPPKPAEHAVDVSEIEELTHAREHRLFEGKIARQQLGFVERRLVAALRVPEGDFRNWDEISEWAEGVRTSLEKTPALGAVCGCP